MTTRPRARKDVTFFLDDDALEDHATLGGSGPNLRDASRQFRDVLAAKGYPVTYTEVPGGQHAPPYWMTRLLVGIVTLTAGWHRRRLEDDTPGAAHRARARVGEALTGA